MRVRLIALALLSFLLFASTWANAAVVKCYAARFDNGTWKYNFTNDSCGAYCQICTFYQLYGEDVDDADAKIQSNEELPTVDWYYSFDYGENWTHGGNEGDSCDWLGDYWYCEANAELFNDWYCSDTEPNVFIKFEYYTSGISPKYTKQFHCNCLWE